MVLPEHINDREYKKFVDINGDVYVRVTGSDITGTFTLGGLRYGGRISSVNIDNTTWTPLPAVPFSVTDGSGTHPRNCLSIQNDSGQEIKINFDNTVVGYTGVKIIDQGERAYDIQGSVIIYAKSKIGPCTIQIEELA